MVSQGPLLPEWPPFLHVRFPGLVLVQVRCISRGDPVWVPVDELSEDELMYLVSMLRLCVALCLGTAQKTAVDVRVHSGFALEAW
jgi:hypothetical protein